MAEDPPAARPLELAAAISPDPARPVHGRGRRRRASWPASTGTRSSLLLWQAPLPDKDAAERSPGVRRARRIGRSSSRRARPASGDALRRALDDLDRGARPAFRSRAGAATRTCWRTPQSGAPLPVGAARGPEVLRALPASSTALATLARRVAAAGAGGDRPRGGLLLRDDAGAGDSSLATSGVVFYVLVQRALAAGAASLGSTRQLVAGDAAGEDPAPLEASCRRRGGALDRLPVSPRRLRSPATGCWP